MTLVNILFAMAAVAWLYNRADPPRPPARRRAPR